LPAKLRSMWYVYLQRILVKSKATVGLTLRKPIVDPVVSYLEAYKIKYDAIYEDGSIREAHGNCASMPVALR
jgi:hypothetical protein